MTGPTNPGMVAAVFVMPSLVEAFGVVYLEAMACGTVVIGTTNGGTKELITDRKDGLLVHPGDTKKLAGLIVEALRDDDLRSTIVDNSIRMLNTYHMKI